MSDYYASLYCSAPSSSTSSASEQMKPLRGDVPTAVQKLLESTKRLQEVLKLWSVERATETDVSDIYVQVGHEFNATVDAFAYYNIDLSDIHSVPTELRTVLEHCIGEDPSPEVLASFMPDLRRVLHRLLKGLQSRQGKWRAAESLDRSRPHSREAAH